jgi:DNA-binding XRE family transcriptional regulator
MVKHRLEKDLTQVELAKKVNISNRTISEIERGNRNPSGKLAKKLADVLEVDMSKFFEEENEIA